MPPRNLPGTTDRRIDALLTLLSENPMIVISGQKIAREIGVSRSTVWRWTQKLRALGVRVKGHPRTGYQIERVPDVLSPNLLRRRLRDSHFRQAHLPFLQGRLDQRHRHGAGTSGRAARRDRPGRGANRRARARRAHLALGKNQRHLRDGACCGRRFRRCSRR